MDFQNNLIKRKEYFGLVWIAAHRPSKLSKVDIIHMDLTKKCKDLSEYIINTHARKKNMKPKLSLLVSSHLMKGLVTILKKKHYYLYDELVNLKVQISRSYTLMEPKKTLKPKTPKKVKALDKDAIEIQQNFPDIMNVSSIESMVFAIDKSDMHQKSITMLEDDFINQSALIPIDFDYTVDQFGPATKDDSNFLMPMIDDYTIARMEGDRQIESIIEQQEIRPGVTSTDKKSEKYKERMPFGDLSNLPHEKAREEMTTEIAGITGHNILNELDQSSNIHPINIEEKQLQIPQINLFEPTVLENIQQSDLFIPEGQNQLTHLYESGLQENMDRLEPRGMVKTFSADITALKEDKLKRQQILLTRKRKHHNLIIDQNTELTVSETEKIRRLNKPYKPGTEQYNAQVEERKRLFREENTWLMTRNDYQSVDLFKEPYSNYSRRINVLNRHQQSFSIHIQSILKYKSLTTARQKNDSYFYLTETIEDRFQDSIELPKVDENSIAEKARKEISRTSGIRTSILIEEPKRDLNTRTSLLEQERDVSKKSYLIPPIRSDETLDRVPMMQSELEQLPQFEPIQNFVEDMPLDSMHSTGMFKNETTLMEIDNYETLLVNSIVANVVVLQELIKQSELPDKCKQMQKPRKFFAAKMFMATLNLAAKKSVIVKQKRYNGPITVKAI